MLQPFEANQENPDVNGGVDDRQDQRDAVLAFVNGILGANANANVVVLGDFNEFEFVSPVQGFDLLTNLTTTLPENERYTYIFEGNSQSLDHCLVSNSLTDKAALDIVHVNAEFNEDAARASDHEPLVCEVEIADSAVKFRHAADRIFHGGKQLGPGQLQNGQLIVKRERGLHGEAGDIEAENAIANTTTVFQRHIDANVGKHLTREP